MKAQKVQALPALAQLHDPRLGLLEREAVPGEDRPQRREGALGFHPAVAHHDQIISEAHQHPGAMLRPAPVKPVQVDVAKRGRNNTALGGTVVAAHDRSVLHHS